IVDEFEVLPNHYSNSISYKGKEYPVKIWLDMLENQTAESLAVYTEKFYAGRTAVSKNQHGSGIAYYVGVMGNSEFAYDFLEDVAEDLKLSVTKVPDQVFVSRRVNETDCFTFYINLNRESTRVVINEK